MSTTNRHFIALKGQIYERLAAQGRFGETPSDLINRLLDVIENKEFKSWRENRNLEPNSEFRRNIEIL